MDDFLVYRSKREFWEFVDWELAGQFVTLKEAEAYAKNCRDWGFQVRIYQAL